MRMNRFPLQPCVYHSKDEREEEKRLPHQYVEAGRLQQSDLVGDGEGGESWQPLGKFHNLDDAFGGELTELVPQTQIQLDTVV